MDPRNGKRGKTEGHEDIQLHPVSQSAVGFGVDERGRTAEESAEGPRRPSVPFHTRNLIRQLPSRNLDDLNVSEPDSVLTEHPRGDVGAGDTTSRRQQREKWRYLTLRVRAATAHNTSDMNADSLYQILRGDSDFSEAVALATLRNSKQSLTLKRSVKRRLTLSRRDSHAQKQLAWWRRARYAFAMVSAHSQLSWHLSRWGIGRFGNHSRFCELRSHSTYQLILALHRHYVSPDCSHMIRFSKSHYVRSQC